jgi:hypothetical protein
MSDREMFTANFKAGREREAQLCVYVGETRVIDLWGSATGDKAGWRHVIQQYPIRRVA